MHWPFQTKMRFIFLTQQNIVFSPSNSKPEVPFAMLSFFPSIISFRQPVAAFEGTLRIIVLITSSNSHVSLFSNRLFVGGHQNERAI